MANTLTIVSKPGYIQSAYRPLIFNVTSSVVAPEIQLRCELFARNDITQAFSMISTKYVKKYMGLTYFIADFSNILQTMLSVDRNILETPGYTSPCLNSIVEYKVRFTEIYYTPNGIPNAYNTLTSDVLRAVNAIPQHQDVQTLIDYILPSLGGGTEQMQLSGDFSPDFE